MATAVAPISRNGYAQKPISVRASFEEAYTVYKTKEYGLFKILKDNRGINEAHIHRLKKSFEHKHLVCPLIVNEKYEVIDGQHRLEASKLTGVPLYFIIVNGYTIEDVQILNANQKNWNKYDFMNMYCERGYKHYLQLREFMDFNPDFKIVISIRLLEGPKDASEEIGGLRMKARRFEEGKFEVLDYSNTIRITNKIKEFKPFFELYASANFVGAILKLLTRKKYNHAEMLHKLEASSIKLKECNTVEEYLLLLEKIYNYKRPDDKKVNLRYSR